MDEDRRAVVLMFVVLGVAHAAILFGLLYLFAG